MNKAAESWQLLPPLTEEEYAALKADIVEHGVLVPIVVDADTGAIVDGHHRQRAWDELRAEGAEIPEYPARSAVTPTTASGSPTCSR